MTHRLALLGKHLSQPLQRSSMAYDLGNRTPSRWFFVRQLLWHASDSLLKPKIFTEELIPKSPRDTVERLTNPYVTPTPWLKDTWGGLVGINMWSNNIIPSRNLFYVENCASLSDLFVNRNQGGPTTWWTGIDQNGSYGWNVVRYWWENTRTGKTRSTLEVYNEESIFIPVEITEHVVKLVKWNLLGSLGPGGKNLESLQGWLLKFGQDSKKLCISIEIFSIGCSLPRIYVWHPTSSKQAVGHASIWCWGNLETTFLKVCAEGNGTWSHHRVPGWPYLFRIKGDNCCRRPQGSRYLGRYLVDRKLGISTCGWK